MPSEIIVYLDDYKYSEGGKYEEIYLDFRTDQDFTQYLKAMGLESKQGSYLRIENYQPQKRLTKGAYYALNTRLLKTIPSANIEQSLLLFRSYDFSNAQNEEKNKYPLLMPHGKLPPEAVNSNSHQKVELPEAYNYKADLSFQVNDVSQANWNEIRYGEQVVLVYDIGAPIKARASEVKHYIDKYAASYADDKPWLVISHWDKDHFHCLYGMDENQLKCFSGVICVDKMKSRMSKSIYASLLKALGPNKLFCRANKQRTAHSDYPQLQLVYNNSAFTIYIAENSRNINYSGIIMVVSGYDSHVVLTGDCLPVQASDAMEYAHNHNNTANGHYLVVPHHGGNIKGKDRLYQIPLGIIPKEAIISVDENNNSYGHPSNTMMDFLQSLADWQIARTDQNGTIHRNLSHDPIDDYKAELDKQLIEELEKNSDFFKGYRPNGKSV